MRAMTGATTGREGGARAAGVAGALAAVLVALAFAAHRAVLGVGLVGHDTLPVILTSRVRSLADLGRLFGSKLMGDRFDQDYWRPVLSLGVALDERLFGLAPAGYQAHSILLLGLAGWALALLARRALLPCGRGLALACGAGAGALFVLHPVHAAVLPIVPRRHEDLTVLFGALALALHLAQGERAPRRPLVAPAALALLAMGSKETAFALAPLATLAAFLAAPAADASGEPGLARRARGALVASAGSWLALVVAFGARWLAVGGVGGPQRPNVDVGLHPEVAAAIARGALLPLEPMRSSPAALPLLGALALAAATTAVLAARSARPWSGAALRAGLLGTATALGAALLQAAGERPQPWYPIPVVAGLCLALAALAAAAFHLLHERAAGLPARAAAGAALALALALAGWQARYSPLVVRYPEWEKADLLLERFFGSLRPTLAEAKPGTAVRAPAVPMRVVGSGEGVEVSDAAVLSQRSVQAWTELVFPGRRFRVVGPEEGERPRPGEVLVVFRRLKNVDADLLPDRGADGAD